MLKKILVWTLYAALVGILIFGAVNRTAAKTDQDSSHLVQPEGGAGAGQARDGSGNNGQSDGPGKNGQAGGSGNNSISGGTGINGQANESGKDLQESDLEEHDWVVLTGAIVEFNSDSLWVQSENSGNLEITGRAWRFAQESGYLPAVGNEVKLTGFYENGKFEASTIEDLTSGQIILLREDTGRPLWSGGGNR
ncbi:MAG: hypothetical protein WBB69_11760 [Anaerolineales bacterium]